MWYNIYITWGFYCRVGVLELAFHDDIYLVMDYLWAHETAGGGRRTIDKWVTQMALAKRRVTGNRALVR